jgi:hypothetical protein
MIIRRKPLGTDNIRKPQSLGLSLLREGIARVQALTVRRSAEADQAPDWGEGIPEEVYDSIYAPSASVVPADQVAPDQFETFDQSSDSGFYSSAADAIARAEAPVSRPPSNTARRTVRRQAQAQAQAQPPTLPAVITPPPAPLPVATPPAEITPAPRSQPARPVRRQALSDTETMPSDLQAMWNLHKQLGHVRERPTGEAAQREAEERANRPRRRAAIVEMSPPKKGLPLEVPDDSVPSSASPIGEPIQRKADGSPSVAPATRAGDLTASDSGAESPTSYTPDYYESGDDADFAPVNNTFDGGDSSPEAEFSDDASEGSAVQRTESDTGFDSYDSGATLVDFPNDVRRTAQNAPQNTSANQPFAPGPTSSAPQIDSRADQTDASTVQRSPGGSTREFSPSPRVTGDPLSDSDDEPGAASFDSGFDLGAPTADMSDSIRRSAAIQAAISRAESPGTPDQPDDSAAYDYADNDSADTISELPASKPSRSTSAPSASAQRTPAAPTSGPSQPRTPSAAVPRSAARTDDSSLAAPSNTENAPTIANTDRATARAAAIARAEQPAPPESPESAESAAPFAPSASARPVQRQVEKPGQSSPQQPAVTPTPRNVQRSATPSAVSFDAGEVGFESESTEDTSFTPTATTSSNRNDIQRSAARAAAIARAEQPTLPADFDDVDQPSTEIFTAPNNSISNPPNVSRQTNVTSTPADAPKNPIQRASQPPGQPPVTSASPQNVQRTAASDFDFGGETEAFDADGADVTDSMPLNAEYADQYTDAFAPPAPSRTGQPAVQRTTSPDQPDFYEADYENAADTGFSDYSNTETNTDWAASTDRSSARDAAIARAEQPSSQPAAPNVPPVQRAARADTNQPTVQRSASDDFDDSADSADSQINAPAPMDRASARAAAIARAEQPPVPPTAPNVPPVQRAAHADANRPAIRRSASDDFGDSANSADIEINAPAPMHRASARAAAIARAEQPSVQSAAPNMPQIQRSAGDDFGDSVDSADSGINAPASLDRASARADANRPAIQRSVSDDFGDSADNADTELNAPAPMDRASARAAAIARAEQPSVQPTAPNVPPVQRAARAGANRPAIQRSASDDFDDSADSADSQINAPAPMDRASARAAAIARAEQPPVPPTAPGAPPVQRSSRPAVQRTSSDAFDGPDAFAYDHFYAASDDMSADIEAGADYDYADTDTANPVMDVSSRADRSNPSVQRSAAPDYATTDGFEYVSDDAAGDSADYGVTDNPPPGPADRGTVRRQAIARAEQPNRTEPSRPPNRSQSAANIQRSADFTAYRDTPDTVRRDADQSDLPDTDTVDSGYDGYSDEYAEYSADSDSYSYDEANTYGAAESPSVQSPQTSLPALPAARAVQRYAESETTSEAETESSSESAQRPALNWPKLRRKAQPSQAPQTPQSSQTESVQRSPDADQPNGDQTNSGSDAVAGTTDSSASAEEVDMLAMLGLPPTTRIGRGPSQTTEAAPAPDIQRHTVENTAQRAVEIQEIDVNANISANNNNNNNSTDTGNTDTQSEADEITKNDVETIAQEVYRQLRNRLRIERERTRGNG